MKKLVVLFIVLAIASCKNTTADPGNEVRDLAKRDIMEKLDLPEGTQFNDEDFEVTPVASENDSLNTSYLVKISVKSQDQDGNEMVKTHTLLYEKIGGNSNEYELATFESE